MSYNNYQRPEKKYNQFIEYDFLNDEYDKEKIEASKEELRKACAYWKNYPDRFLDMIKPSDCKIDLFFYQRIMLRVLMRYKKVYLTFTRGTSKSFTEILAMYLKCMFYPGTHQFVCAPTKQQAADISQAKLEDIWEYFPILKNEVKKVQFMKDYTRITFTNGSKLDVVQAKESQRGQRRHGGAIEEIVDESYDPDILNSVVLPMMATNRIASCKEVDKENEIHKNEWYITTAGTKQTYAYRKMAEIHQDMIRMVIDEDSNKSAINIGAGYELPCMTELLDIDDVMEKKESPTFNPMGFMREYESVWTGSNEKSLISIDVLNKMRTINKAEHKNMDKSWDYVLAYDVARSEGVGNAQSALAVFKIKEKNDGTYYINLVNMFSFDGTREREQALFLKQKVNEFKPIILIVDGNGVGSGVVGLLTTDLGDGNPVYHVVNDRTFDKYRVSDGIPILFNMKTNKKEMDAFRINTIAVSYINNERVKILKHSGIAQNDFPPKIKTNPEKLSYEIRPFQVVDILCDEIMNLEFKARGNEIDTKRISRAIQKDKWSALEYGIFWIYLQEDKNKTRKEQKLYDINDLMKSFKKPKAKL